MSEEPKLEELDRLITRGKQKGFLTYDEVNDALPSDIVSLDQLDDIMMMFGAMDIEVVDSAKAGRLPSEVGRERQPAPAEEADDDGPADSIDLTPGPVGRTEDPVRRSEEHTSELQSRLHLVCRLLLEKKKKKQMFSRANLRRSRVRRAT